MKTRRACWTAMDEFNASHTWWCNPWLFEREDFLHVLRVTW